MVAVGDDRGFAGSGAICREIFGGVVFFRLLVAADEEDGAFYFRGIPDQVGRVGSSGRDGCATRSLHH